MRITMLKDLHICSFIEYVLALDEFVRKSSDEFRWLDGVLFDVFA